MLAEIFLPSVSEKKKPLATLRKQLPIAARLRCPEWRMVE